MQSFREQSNYHGSQQTYPPEAHGTSRIEEYSPRQQAQMFQGSYGGRRAATGTPTTVTPGDNSSLQSYQTYRKDSGDFYYLGSKEGSAAGSQAPQRRPSGPMQNYGPPQGSNSSGSTGFAAQYGREGQHSQFSGQHSATATISQYSQDFPGSFSPSGGQYSSPVSTQQLRQQLYQSHHPISQSASTAASTGASHLQQLQRSPAISSAVGYPLRMSQYGQHYQSSAGSSTSYPPQRFGQSGANYEGYSPGGTSSPYESTISGSSYGAQQQGFSSYSQHLKNFETTKIPQGGNQGQQQHNPHVVQFSNSSKVLAQSQAGQFSQTEVPARSPMQFQQNFSPISNPSPAASVVQSPTCSSTPSPLMTSGENIQCSQGSVQHPSRNRVLPMMPQLSPNTQIVNYKGFGVEDQPDKRLTDPGLSSLSALSSQVANLPNTVQHMLLSDALAPNKKGSKRSRKTDSCANSETSSQAEEQLKSPMTESLDGSCSSSLGDPGERVRQLSGQSSSSEAGYKGPPSEKPASPVQVWQTEPSEKTADEEPDTVPEHTESYQEVPKLSEKSVGVIVSMETVTNRVEKVVDEVPKPIEVDSAIESNLPKTAEESDNGCFNNQNGEPSAGDSMSATTTNVSQAESTRSPVSAVIGTKEAPMSTKIATNLPQITTSSDSGNVEAQSDLKPERNDKFPSLLQEVLQGHHQQEGRYARSTQEHPAGMGNSEVVLRSNVLTSQANEQSNRNILGKNSEPHLEAPHWSQWERKFSSEGKIINLDLPTARKYEADAPASSHEPSSGPSERRSVICDISPLRQIVREPSSSHVFGTAQERPADGRPGQSVILPSGMLALEKSNCLSAIARVEDTESPKMQRKRTGEHCMPYSTKDSVRGSASPRSMAYDPNQDYRSHNRRTSNPKRGTGRVGSRGRSPAQTLDLGEKLKVSPARIRGPTEIPHMNPTMSLSEQASREALYSAFFHNADTSALGYHTNSRSSSYGEPHPAFTSPLHYKRQMYQQEEFKEWLGSSAQAILSSSQLRQEMQRKSPRQEVFHVRSPGRTENEGLGYSQPVSYHEPSGTDYSRQLRMNESTASTMINMEIKRNSQKTPCDSASWHLGHQATPAKMVGSPGIANQKPFSTNRESEPHGSRSGESAELPQQGCSVHRPTSHEETPHHNPLIMRRRVRSFISPIPSKRQFPDDKGRSASKDGSEKIPVSHVVSLMDANMGLSAMTEESTKSISEQRSPTAVSLSSPTKTKNLPPRKGRGLKLEAIVQKITSPNVRRIAAACTSESSTEPVTLDDILSLKGKGPDGGSGSMQEVIERTVSVLPSIPCNDEIKLKGLSPKSIDTWTAHDDKQIKKEMDEHPFESKELPQSSSVVQSSSNHFIDTRGDSPAFEAKCPLQVQPCDLRDKDTFAGGPGPVTPKQDIVLPPKGYFPSGKKKGRPVGSVNKQKRQRLQQQQQSQPQQEQQPTPPTTTAELTSLPAPPPPPPPPQMLPASEQELEPEPEPKPKRRRRERRKATGTTKRRRGRQAAPIIVPLEPEIKLKYASQTIDKTETKAKSFFPYIHVENKEELGLSCMVINAEDEEQRWKKITSVHKGQRPPSPQPTQSKVLPDSSFMVQGPIVTESATVGHLVCCFCGKWANYKNLGDLFGPFYTQEYASTLSKNPPPKKSVETPKKVKVRHKDDADGSKSDSDEEDEPQQVREQRSLPAHPRFKRRNRSGDCASSRHAVPSRRKTDSGEPISLDASGTSTADGVSDQGFTIPLLPLDSNEFWMHEGCVLWANGVYFVCGRLYGLQEALDSAREMNCAHCQEPGATLGYYNKGCACFYHFPCAMDSGKTYMLSEN